MSPEKSGKTSETHDIDEATQQDTLKEENNFDINENKTSVLINCNTESILIFFTTYNDIYFTRMISMSAL